MATLHRAVSASRRRARSRQFRYRRMAVVLSGGREAVIFACAAVGTKADSKPNRSTSARHSMRARLVRYAGGFIASFNCGICSLANGDHAAPRDRGNCKIFVPSPAADHIYDPFAPPLCPARTAPRTSQSARRSTPRPAPPQQISAGTAPVSISAQPRPAHDAILGQR
jgi:hypothetical protein